MAPDHSAVQPQQARYGCVIVRTDSWRLENKTGRPGFKWSSVAGDADSCTPMVEDVCGKDAVAVKNKKIISDGAGGVQKNKPAKAPGSPHSASRLSCTGKPAIKAGRCPLRGISGSLRFPLLGSVGPKRGNRRV